jgi:hypothetical protein
MDLEGMGITINDLRAYREDRRAGISHADAAERLYSRFNLTEQERISLEGVLLSIQPD